MKPTPTTLEAAKEGMEEVNLDQLAASSEEAPVIKLANLILVQAIKDRASDIHLEPFEKVVRLRYRVDGALIDATPPPKQMQLALASRLKIMSSLDIAERRLPQDGRMRVKVGGKDFDLRVSVLPTVHGEKIVLRVLDKSNLSASIDKLGLDADTFKQFKAAMDAPHGLISSPARPVPAKPPRFTPRSTNSTARSRTSSPSKTPSNSRCPASTRCRSKKTSASLSPMRSAPFCARTRTS